MSSNRGSHGPAGNQFAASVARRFHLDGRTKVQIAEEFGISRFKVARLLEGALADGLIKVEIAIPDPVDVALSDEVRSAYGLRHALVLNRDETDDDQLVLRRRIAGLAASLLTELVEPDDVLGLVWGRTVNVMVEALASLPRCTVVQLCGVYSRMDLRDSSVETVRTVGALSGGESFPIYAPLVLPDRRTADTLRHQPGISDAFDRFDRVDKAVVAIGAWADGLSTVYDVLDPTAREAIGRLGVRAELAAHLFDAYGAVLTTGLSHHVLSISADQLRRVPEVIALAGGTDKAGAIDAVLRSGLVTTLITDTNAATALLDCAKREPPAHPAIDRATPTRP